jgi:hypothetical protein
MSLFITYDVFKITFDENWMFECLFISKIPFVLYFPNKTIFLNLYNQI